MKSSTGKALCKMGRVWHQSFPHWEEQKKLKSACAQSSIITALLLL